MNVFASFFQVLHSISVRGGCEGQLWWAPSKRGLFKVKSFYSSMASPEDSCFPWKSVWWTPTPLRVLFFVWLVVLGKIITLDNLKEAARYCDGQMLHVQEEWRVCGPFSSSLR